MSAASVARRGPSMTDFVPARVHRFATFDVNGLHHGIAERTGGVSPSPFSSLNLSVKTGDVEPNVHENRRRFLIGLGANGSEPAYGRLTHGRDVAAFMTASPSSVRSELGTVSQPPSAVTFPADAAVSNVRGLTLVMTFADCVPIFLWDEENAVCGLVHGGWRGTALRAASTTIGTMTEAFGTRPAAVRAGIGPCIGTCCYSVGTGVSEAFEAAYGKQAGLVSQGRLDLRGATRMDLVSAGITPPNIDTIDICTSCRKDLFFSHRAENGKTGRFGAAIGLDSSGQIPARTMLVHEYGANYTASPLLSAR